MPATRPPWRELYEAQLAKAKTDNQQRRARVLAHPDLAARLTQPPLNYTRPEQWTGYVPPRFGSEQEPEILRDPAGFPHPGRLTTRPREVSDSPCRAALVEICAEALKRETSAEQP